MVSGRNRTIPEEVRNAYFGLAGFGVIVAALAGVGLISGPCFLAIVFAGLSLFAAWVVPKLDPRGLTQRARYTGKPANK